MHLLRDHFGSEFNSAQICCAGRVMTFSALPDEVRQQWWRQQWWSAVLEPDESAIITTAASCAGAPECAPELPATPVKPVQEPKTPTKTRRTTPSTPTATMEATRSVGNSVVDEMLNPVVLYPLVLVTVCWFCDAHVPWLQKMLSWTDHPFCVDLPRTPRREHHLRRLQGR